LTLLKLPVLLVPMVNIKMKTIKPGANRIVLLVLPLTMLKLPVLLVPMVNIKMKTIKSGARIVPLVLPLTVL